jgi:ribonuclease HI
MLKNSQIHTNIIEEIRRQWHAMKKAGWQITFQRVKAHAGTRGNELADAIAKKAATNRTIPESYTRIPKSVVLRQLEEESLQKWQRS